GGLPNKSLKCRESCRCALRGAVHHPRTGRAAGVFLVRGRGMSGHRYLQELARRVLIYDGAMGTSIQGLGLTAADFGGASLEGCNDYLVVTRPDAIEALHASFLEAGCDVLETDTFRSNRLTLGEYGLGERVLEINRAAAQVARRAADRYATPARPRFVAGSIGPSGYLPSTSDPSLGNITFAELVDVFA